MSSTHIPKRTLAVVDADSDDLTVDDIDNPAYPAYVYSPLPRGDYFRLLELLPGEQGTTLHCNLAHYDLDAFNVPPYKALSYTWGESNYDRLMICGIWSPVDSVFRRDYDIRHPLYCEGKRLLISTNLRDALRRLRHRFFPVKLWVDAVCINQEDDRERSAQIMLMTRIYHHASPVVLWLGEEDDDTDTAFELIHLLAQSILKVAVTETAFAGPLTASNAPARLQAVGVPPVESPKYGSLIRLLDRPVFRRIWCVQEAAVAKTTIVVCGDASRPPLMYATIATAIMVIDKAGWKIQLQRQHADGWNVLYFPETVGITQRNWFDNSLNQQALAYALRMFQATDPRDKVFAILGLLGNYAHRGLHELRGAQGDDECKDGHAHDCPHWREQTRNWAQTKLEANGGFDALMYAANSRIYHLVDQLTQFFDAVMNLVSLIRDGMRGVANSREKSSLITEPFESLGLSEPSTVDSLRAAADSLFIHIRHILDKMTNEFVSSDELAAYNWASKAIEDFARDYDHLHAIYKLQHWSLSDSDYVEDIFAAAKHVLMLLKEGSDYSPSQSSTESSSIDEVQEAQDEDAGEMQGSTSKEDDIHQGEQFRDEYPDAASNQGCDGRVSEESEHHLPKKETEITLNHDRVETAKPEIDVLSQDQTTRTSQIASTEDQSAEGVERSDQSSQGFSSDNMTVHADEVPAEISLMAGSRGWNQVIGLEYMAPRQIPDRPVITDEPIQPWSADLAMLPDYGLSTAEVYRNFTIQCMTKEKSIDMLSSIDYMSGQEAIGLPSWVPDFRGDPYTRVPPSLVLSEHPSQFKQSFFNFGEPEISWSSADPDLLGLSGQIVDTLMTVSTLRSTEPGLESAHAEWCRLSKLSSLETRNTAEQGIVADAERTSQSLDLLEGTAPKCPPSIKSWGQLIGSLSRWFSSAQDQIDDADEMSWKYYLAFLVFLQVQQDGVQARSDIDDEIAESGIGTTMDTMGLINMIQAIVVGRRMAYTEKGHFVFAPEMIGRGDHICIFRGGKAAFVIRPSQNSKHPDTYELLGECFSPSMALDEFKTSLSNNWQSINLI